MRIAIASDDGTGIAAHTGRCAGFVVFDIDAGRASRREYRPNTYTGHARGECHDEDEHGHEHGHGEGHHSHGPLLEALADCQVLVARGLGRRLVADLNERGIDVCVCAVENADDAAALYAGGKLPRVEHGGTCHHR